MGAYFKPLRRKVGVFTLLIACVVTAGWIKGKWQFDRICFWTDAKTQFSLCSTPLGISGTRVNIVTEEPLKTTRMGFGSVSLEYAPCFEMKDIPPFRFIDEWDWQWCGFRNSAFSLSDVPPKPPFAEVYQVWVIPYWSIVTPLTLLSAWLLLIAPRKKTTTEMDEGRSAATP